MPPPADDRPVILLAFANDRADRDARYLQLPQEKSRICDALAKAEWRGLHIEVVTNATPSGLFDRIGELNDRIIGVHFGGHATADGLALEDQDGRPRLLRHGGLARRIGGLPRLGWVFLNGCGTRPHVAAIHEHAQVPVIATSTAIVDDVAVDFSRRFYFELAQGATLAEAFERAESEMEGRPEGPAALVRQGAQADAVFTRMLRPAAGGSAVRCPWVLVPPDDAQAVDATIYDALPAEAPPPTDGRTDGNWPGWLGWLGLGIGGALSLAAVLGWIATTDPGSVDAGRPDGASIARADRGVDPGPVPDPPDDGPPASDLRPAAVALDGGEIRVGPEDDPSAPMQTVSPLYVAATPVTRAQFRAVIGTLPPLRSRRPVGQNPPDDAPVSGVTLADAEAYCARLNRLEKHRPGQGWRLPTEAEWLHACRAGGAGSPAPTDDGDDRLRAVGGPANAWGLRDMLGAVNQWTATALAAPGAVGGQPPNRVLKGGHRWTSAAEWTCDARWSEPPTYTDPRVGLRIVRPAER